MNRSCYNEGDKVGKCFFVRMGLKEVNRKDIMGIFKCQCGKEFKQAISLVKREKITSCGCRMISGIKRRKYPTIGLAVDTEEYSIWRQMRDRCINPNNKKYADYGGRGISVFEPWMNNFEFFYAYVGPRPSINHSLDRYPDANGNYEPGNVRWATDTEQARNKRSNHIIEYNGVSACIGEWSEKLGLRRNIIWVRLNRGYSIEDALYPGKYSSHGKKIPM